MEPVSPCKEKDSKYSINSLEYFYMYFGILTSCKDQPQNNKDMLTIIYFFEN